MSLDDITKAVQQLIEDSCGCVYSLCNIDGAAFRCFAGSERSVTYRARLHATVDVGTASLSTFLREWVSGGNSAVVGGVTLSVDQDCTVEISDLFEEECERGREEAGSDSVAAIVGWAFGAVLLVVVVGIVVTTIVIILKRR